MRIVPALSWTLATDPVETLDPRLLPLLGAIEATGSLASAIGVCELSYRTAWDLLKEQERRLGVALVVLERGRGARLAPVGARLVLAQRTAESRLARSLAALALDVVEARAERCPALKVAASHDPGLDALRDALPSAAKLTLDLAFMGSLHALEQYVAGRAELAGFHVPFAPRSLADRSPFRRLLRARRDRLIRFVDRDQGFILPRGNPARVRTFADLARKQLRFVNRQRGSGTRLVIDRAMAEEGVDARSVVGYGHEEFTHAAVAATIASGASDAGFGLRAAAADYGLAFVPRLRERYYLAVRAEALSSLPVSRLLEALRSPLLQRIVRRLAGYRGASAGRVETVEDLGS